MFRLPFDRFDLFFYPLLPVADLANNVIMPGSGSFFYLSLPFLDIIL